MAQIYWPFNPMRINEGFGWSEWRGGIHDGIDVGAGQGTELRATASGVVTRHELGSDGNGIDIQTSDGWKVRHWHLSRMDFNTGDWVEAGQVIGATGGGAGTWGAGNSTGPHLHWGTKVGGAWVDPASLGPIHFGESAPAGVSASGSVSDLADAVLRGDFGNGPARQATLGDRFAEVQEEVNRRLNGGAPAPVAVVSGNTAIVQPGDGFWNIAQRVWGGDNATIEANMSKLQELNGYKRLFAGDTVILEAPAPEPTPAPVAPEPVPVAPEVAPEPVPIPAEPKPKPTPTPAKEKKPVTKEELASQKAQLDALPGTDLGVIIPTVKGRKIAYALYMVVALVIGNAGVGFAAAGEGWPTWLVVAVAITNNLAVPFGALAIANASDKK